MNIDHIPALPGVYAIKNTVTDKVYIGSSLNMRRRIADHREKLKKGIHASKHLLGAWQKYGEGAFIAEPLEVFNTEWLIAREQHFIDSYQSSNPEFGYNTRLEAQSNAGLHHSDQAKALIGSASTKRVRVSPDEITREMIREKLKERTLPEQHKAAIKKTMKGRPSHRRKLTDSQVVEILQQLEANIPQVKIARNFNTTEQTVCDIKNGRVYKEITEAYIAARQARFEHGGAQ